VSTFLVNSIEGLFDTAELGRMGPWSDSGRHHAYFYLVITRQGSHEQFAEIGNLLYEQMILFRKATPSPAQLYWRTGDRITMWSADEPDYGPRAQMYTRISIPGCKIDSVPILDGVICLHL
jgi:hypothetical protein